MSQLTITFTSEWIREQRENSKRVIRELEKWITTLEGVELKKSSQSQLTVELHAAERENFLAGLARQMTEVFGEASPWEHALFSGDIDGLDLPVSSSECKTPAETEKSRKSKESQETQEEDTAPADSDAPAQKEKKADSGVSTGPDPRQTLEEICSRVPIKHSRELEAYVREMGDVIPMLRKMGAVSSLWHQHLLMAVDAGYGRTEFLSALVQIYKTFGLLRSNAEKKLVREFILLPKGRESEADGYRVTWETVLQAAHEMENVNKRDGLSRAVLYIDISEWQSLLATTEGKVRLRRLNSLCGTFLIVFRVPFIEGHVLRATADALNDILNVRTISVPPAPIEAMVDYARSELVKSGFQLDDNALGSFEQFLLREKVDGSFFGYKTMNKIVQKIIYDKALANCRRKEEKRVIGKEDLEIYSDKEKEERGAADLQKMVGMSEVARRVKEVIVQIRAQKKLAAQGKTLARPSIHMLFTGNPGTGKTTVARIVARMMYEAGILRKGHLIEVKGRDLCGQYIGETAPKTSAICRDAYGSVLFIDEAYSLFRDNYSSGRDYGREALDTLVAEMDNHRDDICVIMAGYKDEMDAMLMGNAGLRGRIPYEIEFPNYTRDELEKIFFSMLDGVFDYEDGLQEAVREFFNGIPGEVFSSKEFSNARLVRNLFERTWGKAAFRQSLEGGELRILKSDLMGALSDSEFKKLLKKSVERAAIGFNA